MILVGRVGRDSEVRGSEDNPVTVFPLATSYTLKTKEGLPNLLQFLFLFIFFVFPYLSL